MPKKKKKALEPTLALGPLERLPHEKGTRVRIKLKPNKPAKYSAFQNIKVVMGADTYNYSEAWSLDTTKGVWDTFSIPADLNHLPYSSDAFMWIQPGTIPSSYKIGEKHSSKTPWGMARGRWKEKTPPVGAQVIRRQTGLTWRGGVMQRPKIKRTYLEFT